MKTEEDEYRVELVYENKDSALIALNLINHTEGEVIQIKYKNSSGLLDSLVAMGVSDGVGPENYTLMSDESLPLITSILDEVPDVSEVVTGAVYVYHTTGGSYHLYYIVDDSRHDEEVSSSFYFRCLEDNKFYYIDNSRKVLVDISENLTDKGSFKGIFVMSSEEYKSEEEIKEGYIYLIQNEDKLSALYYNGMSLNLNEISDRVDSLEEKIEEVSDHYKESTWSLSAYTSSTTVNPGSQVTVTVTSKVSGVLDSLDSISGTGFLSNSIFTESKPGIYTATAKVNSIGRLISTIEAKYGDWTKSITAEIGSYKNVIYGFSEKSSITSFSDLTESNSSNPSSSVSGTYEFTSDAPGYYYFVIPDGVSYSDTPSITEDYIPVYFIKQSSSISGYQIFRIDDKQAPGNHKFIWH